MVAGSRRHHRCGERQDWPTIINFGNPPPQDSWFVDTQGNYEAIMCLCGLKPSQRVDRHCYWFCRARLVFHRSLSCSCRVQWRINYIQYSPLYSSQNLLKVCDHNIGFRHDFSRTARIPKSHPRWVQYSPALRPSCSAVQLKNWAKVADVFYVLRETLGGTWFISPLDHMHRLKAACTGFEIRRGIGHRHEHIQQSLGLRSRFSY